jgi:hypothetical protein
VRKHIVWASATLALVTAACGSSTVTSSSQSPSPAACVNASAPHHAYVVVEHLSGTSIQKCVGFSTDTIGGANLMDQSGIQYAFQTFSFGNEVCKIDSEPQAYSQCAPQNLPYWALWIETAGAWTSAQVGYTGVTLRDKEALGWRYTQPTDPSPAPPPLAKE